MKILFELSKEYAELPKDEVISCLIAKDIEYSIIKSNKNILIINLNVNKKTISELANRLSFTFYINEFLFSCKNSLDEIKKNAKKHKINTNGSIAINYKKRSTEVDTKSIIQTLAEIYTKNKKVDLENPDNKIRVVIDKNHIYVGLKIFKINRSDFEHRKVQYRPFFSPISLHPKIARALVNLTSIKMDEIILDPFCGTGGIILEAALIGAKVIGSDIEEKMIEGCKKTLDFYKIKNYSLYVSDVGNIKRFVTKPINAIVTDLPYGKSTTTKGEDIKVLYDRAFESFSKILKKDGLVVIGLSSPEMISIGKKYFNLIKIYDFKVHRSMTRYFVIYKN